MTSPTVPHSPDLSRITDNPAVPAWVQAMASELVGRDTFEAATWVAVLSDVLDEQLAPDDWPSGRTGRLIAAVALGEAGG